MKRADIGFLVGAVFVSLTAVFYCCTMWFPIKLPRYYPVEHAWKWVKEKDVPSQGWYGMQVFAYLAAGICALLVYVALRKKFPGGLTLQPGFIKSAALVAILVVVACMGYMLLHEFRDWGIMA